MIFANSNTPPVSLPASMSVLPIWFLYNGDARHQQVAAALAQAGLESSNLIVGIDFTKSNDWTGTLNFEFF